MKKRLLYFSLIALTTAFIGCVGPEAGADVVNDVEAEEESLTVNDISDSDESSDNENNGSADSDKDNNDEKEEKSNLVDFTVSEFSGQFVAIKKANVRSLPTPEADKLGELEVGDIVEVTGYCSNGYYRFKFNDTEGYVNNVFFQDKASYDAEQAEIKRIEEEKKKAEEEAKEKAALEAQKKAEEEAKKQAEAEKAAQEAQRQAEEEAKKQAEAEAQAQAQAQGNNNQSQSNASFQSRVVELCNEQRAAAGLAPLTEDGTLDSCAAIRAGEIISVFDHTRPDGSSCFTVLDNVSWSMCGENIAAGQTTPEQVVNDWMNSEGHRANIMNPSYKKIGVGYTTGGSYGTGWVQLFTD